MTIRCRGNLWRRPALVAALLLLISVAAVAVEPGHGAGRNFDARTLAKATATFTPSSAQQAGVARLRAQVPELMVRFDARLGVTRTLRNPVGFLTATSPRPPMEAALDFVAANLDALGLTAADVAEFEVTDQVTSSVSGATHIYLRQMRGGIPSYNSQLQVNVARDGQILSVNNAFLPGVATVRHIPVPKLSAAEAVVAAVAALGSVIPTPVILSTDDGPQRRTQVDFAGISSEPIEARLMWLPIQRGQSRLVWNFQIWTLDQQHVYDFTIDARDGKLWTRFDWVSDASYRVYAQPTESPIHTTPLPPADARSLEVNPQANATNASPNGWHSTGSSTWTITRGNNVHAYEDRDANNQPPANEVQCGDGFNCDFSINLAAAPNQSIPAAVTNLFYWNNIIHDIQYQYGFDEAAGNFQVNTFGRGGAGGDDVRAEAQDGSGNCNANFLTPPDGSRPRMQMYTCTNASPARDGDYDDGVIVHEYGHGISNRQVGGPSMVSCLNNAQQPGEGWSDWFGLVYTAEAGDAGPDQRGTGSYLFNLAPNGTIRPQPYSTNPTINNYTYASIAGKSVPHGVGSVWAQGIWEVYWALVEEHGFHANLYDANGGAGNQRALLYVNEGLKNTACGPTFLDARDGIIDAALSISGVREACLVWRAFARYGLGVNASTPGPGATTATNGFRVPGDCAIGDH
jgi:extracellular elastinolytic metalloproteinase